MIIQARHRVAERRPVRGMQSNPSTMVTIPRPEA